MSRKQPKGVDPKVYDLAELFLKDVKPSEGVVTAEDTQELAEGIQETIEDFISALVNPDGEEGP